LDELARGVQSSVRGLAALSIAPALAAAVVPAGNLILNPGAEVGSAALDDGQSFFPPHSARSTA
jgi:hypothetical protein